MSAYPRPVSIGPAPYIPSVTTDVIIDISHYETVNQDFTATVAYGIKAVILKATQGTLFVDQTFLPRVTEARAAGLLVGAYHFLDGSDPLSQMAHFLTIAKREGSVDWLAVDWEAYPPSQASVLQAAIAVSSIHATTGTWPVIYMDRFMLSAPNITLSNCPLWLAEYGTRPICPPGFAKWQLHQYTDGTMGPNPRPVPGIGPCDRSVFAGTVDQLRTWWAR